MTNTQTHKCRTTLMHPLDLKCTLLPLLLPLSLSSGHTHTHTKTHSCIQTKTQQPKQDSCWGNRPQGTFSPERLLHYWKTSSFMSTGTSCLPEQVIRSRTCTPAYLVTWECPVNRSCHIRCTGRADLGVHRLRNPLGPDTDGTDNVCWNVFFSLLWLVIRKLIKV